MSDRSVASRDAILDAAERLMADRGYDGASIAAIRAASGLPASSIYWHFGSKNGLLAAVMERGVKRWFASLPAWDDALDADGQADPDRMREMLRALAGALKRNPEFLRLFYVLALGHRDDADVRALVRSVRQDATERWREVMARLVAADVPAVRRGELIERLTTLSVAVADGAFVAASVDETDIERLVAELAIIIPAVVGAELGG